MSFSRPNYLEEVRNGVVRFEPFLIHLCLVAPLAVAQDRLRMRGADPGRHAWQYRRAAECCAVHGDPTFAHQIDAAHRAPEQLADEVLAVIQADLNARAS